MSANSSELDLAELNDVKVGHIVHKHGLKRFIVLAAVIAALGTYMVHVVGLHNYHLTVISLCLYDN